MSLSPSMVLEMQMAKHSVPRTGTLEEKLSKTMVLVREHRANLMGWHNSDDELFRISVGAVMLSVSEEDKDLLVRSMAPLHALSAAISGVPVDFSAINPEGIVPLLKLWHESKPQENTP